MQTRQLPCGRPASRPAGALRRLCTIRNASGGTKHSAACRASGATPGLMFPRDLPLFPVQPVGVFVPGMTKTLHLYESHFVAMLEEAKACDGLLVISVMEPFLGKPEQAASMGAHIGGSNAVFSCSCLVKVMDVKPFLGGYLARIRGEARLGVSNILQVEPYHRACVYSLPDPAPTRQETQSLPAAVEHLDEVMRGVQLLASKFRCDETAAIQQAFRYINEEPLVPTIQEPLPALQHGDGDTVMQPPVASSEQHEERHLQQAQPREAVTGQQQQQLHQLEGNQQQGHQPSQPHSQQSQSQPLHGDLHTTNMPGQQQVSNQQQQQQQQQQGQQQGQGQQGQRQVQLKHSQQTSAVQRQEEIQGSSRQYQGSRYHHSIDMSMEEEPLDLQRASRLSYASLQWVPESTVEEKYSILRGRLLAMEASSVTERLQLATAIMEQARASLAAKCAIITLGAR